MAFFGAAARQHLSAGGCALFFSKAVAAAAAALGGLISAFRHNLAKYILLCFSQQGPTLLLIFVYCWC